MSSQTIGPLDWFAAELAGGSLAESIAMIAPTRFVQGSKFKVNAVEKAHGLDLMA
jgi:hypothetical protein